MRPKGGSENTECCPFKSEAFWGEEFHIQALVLSTRQADFDSSGVFVVAMNKILLGQRCCFRFCFSTDTSPSLQTKQKMAMRYKLSITFLLPLRDPPTAALQFGCGTLMGKPCQRGNCTKMYDKAEVCLSYFFCFLKGGKGNDQHLH